jgi:uncharacterized protein (DUF362 family)
MDKTISRVTMAHTRDRAKGVTATIKAMNANPVSNKNVLIKPNFNTADTVPGSTHNDTLEALIQEIWAMGAKSITLGERSYPPTQDVIAQKNVKPMLDRMQVELINFDDLAPEDWVPVKLEDSHWPDGLRVARPILEAECLVYTCCIKTHPYGGIITMALKLSVGVVPTSRNGFPHMSQLHGSPHQRKMIAEINAPFKPDLIVMDGVDAFVDGGPMTGKRANGNIILAADDRVAMDAVGVAVLKHLGSNSDIMNTPIFRQEQIARAAELGLGAGSPDQIDLVPVDDASRTYRDQINAILQAG